jgi:hypothetical protein
MAGVGVAINRVLELYTKQPKMGSMSESVWALVL